VKHRGTSCHTFYFSNKPNYVLEWVYNAKVVFHGVEDDAFRAQDSPHH